MIRKSLFVISQKTAQAACIISLIVAVQKSNEIYASISNFIQEF